MKSTLGTMPRKAIEGFTLFEVLVAMVIIAIITGISIFGFSQSQARQRLAEIDRLHLWLNAAAEQSVLSASVLGVVVRDQQLSLAVFYKQQWFVMPDQQIFEFENEIELSWAENIEDQQDSWRE